MTAARSKRLNRKALIFAALVAPAAAWILFLIVYLPASLSESLALGGAQTFSTVMTMIVFIPAFAIWGLLPATIFGGMAMALVGPTASLGLRLLGGLGAAAAYLGFGLLLAPVFEPGAVVLAPWAIQWDEGEVLPSYYIAYAAIVASGLVGGWVYDRIARRG